MRGLVWMVVIAALGSCIEAQLVLCSDGRACAAGMVCDIAHAGCVEPEQIAACDGVADDADCVAGAIVGGCFDGVCLRRGCGNAVVEASELCDDGNLVSGDGCRGDCVSNETCRNGEVDPGEDCDDNNAISRDGCDSTCASERRQWTITPVAPGYGLQASYDENRGRFVLLTATWTWEWDGTSWSAVREAPPVSSGTVYEETRQRVTGIAGNGLARVFEWSGTSWSERPTTSPVVLPAVVWSTYDPIARVMRIVGGSAEWTLDAAGVWTGPSPAPALNTTARIAFDAAANRVVLVDSTDFDVTTWVRSSAGTWTSASSPGLPVQSSLVYDADRGRVMMLGGSTASGQNTDTFEYVNDSWAVVASAALPRADYESLMVDHDATNHRLVASRSREVLTFTTTWQVQAVAPLPGPRFAAQPDRDRFVLMEFQPGSVSSRPVLWTWNGRWQRHGLAPAYNTVTSMAFDHARGAMVMTFNAASHQQTWSLAGDAWQTIQGTVNEATESLAMVYDERRRRMLLFGSENVWGLDHGQVIWQRLRSTPTDLLASSAARDPRNDMLLVSGSSGVLKMTGDGLEAREELSAGPAYTVYANERRSSIELLSLYAASEQHVQHWEYRDGAWFALEDLPFPVDGGAAYDAKTGDLLVYAADRHDNAFMLVRSYADGGPLETCANATDDLDGDTLTGCADPDCWWACQPLCPPLTTCL